VTVLLSHDSTESNIKDGRGSTPLQRPLLKAMFP
jgi:hypothetical protein